MSITAEVIGEFRKLFPERCEAAEREAAQREQHERQDRIDRIAEAEAALQKQLPGLEKAVAEAEAKRAAAEKAFRKAEEAARAARGKERAARIQFDHVRDTENAALRRGAPDRIADELDRLERLRSALCRIPRDVLEVKTIHGPMSSRTVEIRDHAKRGDEFARITTARDSLRSLTEAAPMDWNDAIDAILKPVADLFRKAGVR